jgi:hypothetical protein
VRRAEFFLRGTVQHMRYCVLSPRSATFFALGLTPMFLFRFVSVELSISGRRHTASMKPGPRVAAENVLLCGDRLKLRRPDFNVFDSPSSVLTCCVP